MLGRGAASSISATSCSSRGEAASASESGSCSGASSADPKQSESESSSGLGWAQVGGVYVEDMLGARGRLDSWLWILSRAVRWARVVMDGSESSEEAEEAEEALDLGPCADQGAGCVEEMRGLVGLGRSVGEGVLAGLLRPRGEDMVGLCSGGDCGGLRLRCWVETVEAPRTLWTFAR